MSASRTQNSVRNIAFNFLNQIVSLVMRFINRSVFIQVLGVEYLGISGLFSDILQMLSMADLGLNTAMVFSLYKPLAEENESEVAALVHAYKKIYNWIALIVTIVGISLVPFLKCLINLDQEIPYVNLYYLFFLANTVASYLVVYKTSVLTADQKGYVSAKINSISSVIRTIVMTLFLYITRSYFAYLTIQVIFTYATNFYVSFKAEQLYPFIKGKAYLEKKRFKSILGDIKSVFIYKLSGVLVTATDNTLISVMIGTVWVGLYSNYSLITTQLTNLFNTIFSSLSASVGNLVVCEDEKERYRVFSVLQSASLMICSFCSVCIFLLIPDFITVWLGKEYLMDNLTLIAITTNFYFSIILMPVWTYREATGMYRKTKYVMLATAVVNLIVSIALGKIIGLSGIIFATTIARLSTYFWYEPRILFLEYFKRSCGLYYKQILTNGLLTIIMTFFGNYVFKCFYVSGWMSMIVKGVLIAGYAMLVLVVFYRNSEVLKWVMQKFVNRKNNLK